MVLPISNNESGLLVRKKLNDNLSLTQLRSIMNASMIGNNKMLKVPWTPAPAWVTGEVVIIGVRRINDGREWACIVGGTTATAPTVSGSAGGLFTDGSVIWENIGAAVFTTALPNGPTYSLSSSAPGLTKFYTNATSTWAHGAAYPIKNNAWFNMLGFYDGLTANGIGDYAASKGAIGFWTDAAQIVLAFAGAATTGTVVEIDGALLSPSTIMDTTTSGATNYLTINLPTTKGPHWVVVWRKTHQGSFIRGVYCPVTASLWADASLSTKVKWHYITDSQGDCELYKGANWDRTLQNVEASYLGVYNVQSDASSGTGFVAGGSGIYGSATRMNKINSFQPDVIEFWMSNNDTGQDQATLTNAMNAWYNTIRGYVPNAWIIASGQMNPATGETAMDGYGRQAVAAWVAAGDTRVLWLPTTGDAGGPWHTGSGKINSVANDGNADIYRGDDGLHFCQRGKEHFGRRRAEGLRKLLNAA